MAKAAPTKKKTLPQLDGHSDDDDDDDGETLSRDEDDLDGLVDPDAHLAPNTCYGFFEKVQPLSRRVTLCHV